MVKLFHLNARVIGKCKKHRGQYGTVTDIRTKEKSQEYIVTWDNGGVSTVGNRSIDINYTEPSFNRPTLGKRPRMAAVDTDSDDTHSELSGGDESESDEGEMVEMRCVL